MTYNVFGGTLNPAQSNQSVNTSVVYASSATRLGLYASR